MPSLPPRFRIHPTTDRLAMCRDIHHRVRPDQVELVRRDYVANGGYVIACLGLRYQVTYRVGPSDLAAGKHS
jgi:hypothetical protein